ncbi:MAG: tRNA (adenosine(37)-N6)-threonylcarbamoyltransferase complex dimerization subunit type 1 TsaB [Candidatus Methylopumilus sp.]|jgi:tRNA threonylcarbamoyladenosine biosynthesis protein TsaB|nr:tRNA (adenosine(37)-N6)-threonylcarbamoyltransferase complex dimerization subunit type 1 TsaB [Candidatus Methylopumilus sp.]
MQILAIDTSTEFLSLALWLDGRVLSRDIHAGQTHSQQILPTLRELLDEAQIELKELDGIAFGAGPGSFTGLRIACGVAQGLAFGANLPVVGVSTLQALAQQSGAEKVIACLDARMGEIYHAAYEKRNGEWLEVSAPALFKPEDAPKLTGNDWVGVGTGWLVYPDVLQTVYGEQLREMPAPDHHSHPTARSIAELALPTFKAGLAGSAYEAAPIYIRNKVALKISERVNR